jgi:hypothetical protein
MAHKDRDNDIEERPSERRHRAKSEKTEKSSSRPHRLSRSSKPKIIDPETGEVVKSPRRHRKDREKEKDQEEQPAVSMADLVPELARTSTAPGSASRNSLPYPSFDKAYSKEAVTSREDIRTTVKDRKSPYTPESTDVGSESKIRPKSAEQVSLAAHVTKDGRPPSPPETEFSQQRKATPSRMTQVREDDETEQRPGSRNSWFGRVKKEDDQSKLSSKSKTSKASTALKAPRKAEEPAKSEGQQNAKQETSDNTKSKGSDTTSLAPKTAQSDGSGQAPPSTLDSYSSPDSAQDSSPLTPTPTQQFPPLSAVDIRPTPSPFLPFEASDGDLSAFDSPQPPPPPPPPPVPINVPRVDYLLQNGGLPRLAPKTLLSSTPNYLSQNSTPRANTPMPSEIERIFGPYFTVLDQYESVINKNGSLAVATGYRSVARRLLDRLEIVFNRDLSSEGCICVMCTNSDQDEGSKGLGWGEVLEWVSGRRELPVWPAFDFATLGVKTADDLTGLGLSGTDPLRPGSPVKIDPDVAEEFREHYLQQSKKAKIAVNRWLSSCPQTIAAPPREVDDETLSFAIVTHLEQKDRPIFNAILSGSTTLQPASRAPTPLRRPRTDFIMKSVHSLQRLYRLPTPPRDPEAAIYLVKNPHVHHLIATLSSISPSEWEILTSGRFDGFLWSGAESELESPAFSRGPTPLNGNSPRGPVSGIRQGTITPLSYMRSPTFSPSGGGPSRGPTPFSQIRHPVSNDEETEIATLAEVEREIYLGMEMLEDAFEGLHRKAELVRRALRERGAGLSMAMQSRRTSHPDIISAGTPGPSTGMGLGYERPQWGDGSEMASESDCDPVDELQSELAPDDSASNISSSRHRRPKRRTERRTPALMEENEN